MTITAKNIGRINVWPTYGIAREADTEECKFVGQLTVWQTNEEARANISHEEEGGADDRPDWVPADAVIHIDLVGGSPQGRAWVQGTGEVAVDTLLGSDPNTDGAGTVSAYNPNCLTENGYACSITAGELGLPAFIGSLRTQLFSGCTIRMTWAGVNESGSGDLLLIGNESGSNALEYYYTKTDPGRWFKAESWAGDYGPVEVTGIINKGSVAAINCAALTIVSTRSEFAVNGSSAQAGTLVPETHWNDLVAAQISLGSDDLLQSVTLYDPLPDTTGLSELSEIGA